MRGERRPLGRWFWARRAVRRPGPGRRPERAYAHISRHPATGSPRHAHELNLPGLRFWPLTGYPHLVFCVERADPIDVWRVLHVRRDIPAGLQHALPTEP